MSRKMWKHRITDILDSINKIQKYVLVQTEFKEVLNFLKKSGTFWSIRGT
jgi:uncharacterized protein with HEPN domain